MSKTNIFKRKLNFRRLIHSAGPIIIATIPSNEGGCPTPSPGTQSGAATFGKNKKSSAIDRLFEMSDIGGMNVAPFVPRSGGSRVPSASSKKKRTWICDDCNKEYDRSNQYYHSVSRPIMYQCLMCILVSG